VAAAVAVLLAVSAPARAAPILPSGHDEKTTSLVNGQVRKLVVDDDAGGVTVKPGSGTSVERNEHWVYARPRVSMSLSHGVLSITTRCPNLPLNDCSVDVTTALDPHATIEVKARKGNVGVGAMGGPSIAVSTGNGNVQLSGVASRTVSATTSRGNVQAEFGAPAGDASLTTSNGNIAVLVPRGAYALNLRSRSGERVYLNGVTNDPHSPHRLTAATSNGSITVTGR